MPTARYKPLVDRYAQEIRSGRLAPGTRLPTHRQLAAREGLALVTATRVYAELEAMGLVSGEPGRGTFVREVALARTLGIDQQAAAAGVVDVVATGSVEQTVFDMSRPLDRFRLATATSHGTLNRSRCFA